VAIALAGLERSGLSTAATDYTRAHLGYVTLSDVTRAVGVSERTLRRIFSAHLGMSWRSYLLRARGASFHGPAGPVRTVPSSRSQSPWVSTTQERSPGPSPGTAGRLRPPTNGELAEHLE